MWLLLVSVVAATPQVIRLEVAGDPALPYVLEARTVWLGESRQLELQAGPEGWSGQWEGEPLRILPLILEVREGERSIARYEALETITAGRDVLAFALEGDGSLRRSSTAATVRQRDRQDTAGTAAALGWALLVFVYVTWLVRQRG